MDSYIIDTKEAAEEFFEWVNEFPGEVEKIIDTVREKHSIVYDGEEFIFKGEAREVYTPEEINPDYRSSEEEHENELYIQEQERGPEENDEKTKELIFGKDKTEGVVAVEVVGDDVWMFKNNGDVETIPNTYWIVSPRTSKSSEKLDGNLHYKHILKFTDKDEFNKDRGILYSSKADFYSVFDEQEAAMIYNGITCFKGMRVEDVSVLSFDIEANGLIDDETGKPLVGAEAEVFMITNTFRTEKGEIIRKLFSVDNYESDGEMIHDWCEWVQEVNPSIICGHHVFGYDFPYLSYCYKRMFSEDIPLGRDCSPIKFHRKPSKFRKDGSQSYDYFNAKIFGRQIIDTMFLAYKYDFGRKYPSYGLKAIIEFEGLIKEGRQFYDASKIAKNWHIPEEREKIKKYGEHDADDSLALYDLMIPQFFYYAQSIPKSFQKINNSATGSQINSFLVRSYLQIGHSLPKACEREDYEGAISFGNPGVWEHVNKLDVASLYPSIMITEKVYDRDKDPNGHFLKMVDYFTKERLENKRLGNDTKERYYKDVEQGQKIVINSAYGLLGASGLLFNSPKNAAFVTKTGREILQAGIDWAEGKEYQIVNVDTDSFSYTTGKKLKDDEFREHIYEVNSRCKEGIIWEDDGRYKSVLVVKAKNYALKSYDKKKPIKIKGSALKATMKEIALCEFISEVLDFLLTGKKDQLFHLYKAYVDEIIADEIDISRWSSKKTVTKSVLNPERTNEENILNAIKHLHLREGDKFRVYFTNNSDFPMRVEEDYQNDHDVPRLLEKLYKTLKVFETVIDVDSYPNYKLKRNLKLLGLE